MTFSKEELLKTYENLSFARNYEAILESKVMTGKVPGFHHLALGEEAILAGVLCEIGPNDWIQPHYRSTPVYAQKVTPSLFTAELMSSYGGVQKGLAGVAHLYSKKDKIGPTMGLLGQNQALAAGIALGYKMDKVDGCVIIGIGDGTMNEGVISEMFNMIATWKLPVAIYVQNNQYAMSTKFREYSGVEHYDKRIQGFGIPCETYDGTDVIKVREVMHDIIARARKGEPCAAEFVCTRWRGHFVGDPMVYRNEDEKAAALASDPVKRFKEAVLPSGLLTEAEMDAIDAKNVETINNAWEYAFSSGFKPVEFVRDENLVYYQE